MNLSTQMDTINSAPALAAALRMTGQADGVPNVPLPELTVLRANALVPMYRLQARTVAQEIDHAVRVVNETAERLRRLATAYGEWSMFDASAYFDLTPTQATSLVYLVERVSSVHVRFFTDLLLPSFQRAVISWRMGYAPAYAGLRHELRAGLPAINGMRNGNGNGNGNGAFAHVVQPQMIERWDRVLAVVDGVHRRLAGDITLLSMSGSEEERNRWRHYWQFEPQAGLDAALLPALASLRSLTLTFDFPLPISRQPDRLRRLRYSRQRRERRSAQRRKP